jgi:hypothetical protein
MKIQKLNLEINPFHKVRFFKHNKGTIYSEGETLNVTIFLESSDEFSIFKTKIIPKKGLNKIAVDWSPDEIKLFMNGEKIESLNPNDFKF